MLAAEVRDTQCIRLLPRNKTRGKFCTAAQLTESGAQVMSRDHSMRQTSECDLLPVSEIDIGDFLAPGTCYSAYSGRYRGKYDDPSCSPCSPLVALRRVCIAVAVLECSLDHDWDLQLVMFVRVTSLFRDLTGDDFVRGDSLAHHLSPDTGTSKF